MKRFLLYSLTVFALLMGSSSLRAEEYSFDYYKYSGLKPYFYGTEDEPGPTDEEKKCMRRVWLDLGSQTYEVSRVKTLEFRGVDGIKVTIADFDHPFNDCNIIDVGAVSEFTTGYRSWKDINLEVSVLPTNPKKKFITTYQANKEVIDRETSAGRSTMLPDYTRVIHVDKTYIYVLPKKILFTGNGEPVAVYCSAMALKDDKAGEIDRRLFPRTCTAKYVHPDNLGFGYTYREDKDGDHFGMDVLARKRFEEIKIKRAPSNDTQQVNSATDSGPASDPIPEAQTEAPPTDTARPIQNDRVPTKVTQ